MQPQLNHVYFAGGCFWCMEPVFDSIDGVTNTVVGYMGGQPDTANYEDVSSGKTQHIEVVQVTYNPQKTSYLTLLDAFWQSIDPTDQYGQFADRGYQYQTAVFFKTQLQKDAIHKSLSNLKSRHIFDAPIVTKILPESPFYEAESYHQNYYQKNTLHYQSYKVGSGRAGFLKKVWGQPTDN